MTCEAFRGLFTLASNGLRGSQGQPIGPMYS